MKIPHFLTNKQNLLPLFIATRRRIQRPSNNNEDSLKRKAYNFLRPFIAMDKIFGVSESTQLSAFVWGIDMSSIYPRNEML
jgi:hypothetical protein